MHCKLIILIIIILVMFINIIIIVIYIKSFLIIFPKFSNRREKFIKRYYP